MNFIDRIIKSGFVEQGQKKMLELMPEKEKWIPRWWENYNSSIGWFGVNMDHPDAWFRKEGEDKEVQLSLQGMQMAYSKKNIEKSDELLMKNRSARYICLKIGEENIYETFSGEIPSDELVSEFLIS